MLYCTTKCDHKYAGSEQIHGIRALQRTGPNTFCNILGTCHLYEALIMLQLIRYINYVLKKYFPFTGTAIATG